MRIGKIREQTIKALNEAGFKPGSYLWLDSPNRLIVSVRGQLCSVDLNAGRTSGRKLERILGRIQGWAEMLSMMEAQTP